MALNSLLSNEKALDSIAVRSASQMSPSYPNPRNLTQLYTSQTLGSNDRSNNGNGGTSTNGTIDKEQSQTRNGISTSIFTSKFL